MSRCRLLPDAFAAALVAGSDAKAIEVDDAAVGERRELGTNQQRPRLWVAQLDHCLPQRLCGVKESGG